MLQNSRARVYETVRSAHLERAHQLTPAAIVYRHRRYDFDDTLTAGLELVQAGRWRAARLIAASGISELEINEPLMLSGLPTSAVIVALTRLRRQRPRIVTYVIGNADPFRLPPRIGVKQRVREWVERRLASYVWNRVDRVAYGTADARSVYEEVLGAPRRAAVADVPALPARPVDPLPQDRGESVVFLGALVERKGFQVLIDAWPEVVAARPMATLRIIGKGRLEDEAHGLAARDPSVTVVIDPPREEIRGALAISKVLVLASQPAPTWREQVGLPIVEGLEQGCRIVASTETGLAPWLAAHDHAVVAVPTDPSVLADAIVAQLDHAADAAAVVAALPEADGRLAADAWLFSRD